MLLLDPEENKVRSAVRITKKRSQSMSEKGLEASGLVCGAIGLVGSAILEWAPISIPHVSAMAVGVCGAVMAAGLFGLSLAFRGE
jgi:hypothetical protein